MQNFNEFIDYCLSFYGVGGIYPENKRTKEQIAYATTMYLDACAYYENEQDKPWTKDHFSLRIVWYNNIIVPRLRF